MSYVINVILGIQCFLISTNPVTLAEDLKFLVEPWYFKDNPAIPPMKFVMMEESYSINCTTDNSNAVVFLSKRSSTSQPFVNALPAFQDRIRKVGQAFVVSSLALRDTSSYQCSAYIEKGKEIKLELGRLVVLSYKDRDPEIYPGSAVVKFELQEKETLTCKQIGKASVKDSYLKWYREVGGKLQLIDKSRIRQEEEKTSDGQYIDIEILIFNKFSQNDVGTYVCQRKVGARLPTKKSVKVEAALNIAPKITFPQLKETFKSVKQNLAVNIICSVGGVPKPIKYWEKDNKTVQECPNREDPDCLLYIPKAVATDSGRYYCVGKNLVETVKKSIELEVRVSPVVDKPAPIYIAGFKQEFELYCRVTSGNPSPTIQWFYQEDSCLTNAVDCKPLELDWLSVTEQFPDITVPTKSSYIIAAPTQQKFFYRCKAKNVEGSDSYTFTLDRKENALPQFSIQPDDSVTINEQDMLPISCLAYRVVYSELLLTKDKTINIANGSNVVGYTRFANYTISSAQMKDGGIYECKGVRRRGGFTTDTLTVIVKELVAPKISGFVDRTILQDTAEDYQLFCNATGNPPPAISWTFNGISLNSSVISSFSNCKIHTSGIYMIAKKPAELAICKMDFLTHDGEYGCMATNKVSSAIQKMNLGIQAKPRILNWKDSITVALGETIDMECVSYANPPANVTWSRLDASNKTTTLSSRMKAEVLVLGNLQQQDSGKYVCSAFNSLGEVSEVVEVILKGASGALVSTSTRNTIIGVVVAAVLIVLLALIVILLYRRHLKKTYALYLSPNDNFVLDPDRSLFDQSSDLPYDMAWEFPREKLVMIRTLGSGAFGQVWLAEAEGIHGFQPRDKSSAATKRRRSIQKQRRRYHSISVRYRKQLITDEITLEKTMVAVKTLKEDAAEDEYKDLASELKILIHLGEHKNIVNLLGACTTTTKGKLCVILECCPHGNLLNFLRSKRDIFSPVWTKHESDMENEFTYIDLIMIVHQVARGMDFLQSKKCVHRDLAARNVLVGDDYVMKIADFGLARDIYKDEFYLKQTTGLLPVKWMAVESLFDKVYTSMSDVWSFGIVLWEAFTLGGSPYPGLPTEDLFAFLEDGKRMERPEICPKDVYEIMRSCWKKSPYDRPIFAHIVEQLGNILKQNVSNESDYLDFMDGNATSDYLEPTRNEPRSNDYLEASGVTSPKKTEDNPSSNGYTGEDSPLLLDGYIPMTPASDYQTPSAFGYEDPQAAIV